MCLPLASVDILRKISGFRRGRDCGRRTSGTLEGVGWQFVTDVSGKRIIPTFSAQAVCPHCTEQLTPCYMAKQRKSLHSLLQ